MSYQNQVLTVTQLNRAIRNWLECDIGAVCVEGEISNLIQAASGHCYFTLKDTSAQLKCVFFKNRYTKKPPQNGQLVLAKGRLSLYEARGDYQLIIDNIEEAGLGELYRAFIVLKEKLTAAGLFDLERKKPIPMISNCIGIITSSKGAALQDIMTTIRRRYPLASTILYPSDVQGSQAATQLIRAIEKANQEQHCDVLILARGGGSLEDLWPFNHEELAYTIAKSYIPIVSGIGHETDFTIADFVADYRAATPTAAAEKVTPQWQQLHEQFHTLEKRLLTAMQRVLQQKQQRLKYAMQQVASPKQLIQKHEQNVDYLTRQLHQTLTNLMMQKKHTLHCATLALDSLSPLATLTRGYAVATHEGQVLLKASEVALNTIIQVRLAEGSLQCKVMKHD
jgi:exodeoxyribonuclease VII large subunit